MGVTAAERQLKMLTAKKESLFSILQNLLDLSKSMKNEAEKSRFSTLYKSMDSTKADLIKVIDHIMEVSFDVDDAFTPNYAIIQTIDEMCCYIHIAAAKLEREEQQTNASQSSAAASTSHHSSASQGDSGLLGNTSFARNLPSLPKIELPEFSGHIREWETFYSIFKSLIHDNKLLTNVDKVNYLVGRLKGSALSVCTGLAPTGDNYDIIWKSLVDKYQDERSLATSYLDQILGFKHIQGESAKNLESFLEKFDCAVQALKNLKMKDLADFILVHQALAKLDSETVKSFEMSVRGKGIPAYEDVIKFVKQQAKILNLNRNATTGRGNCVDTKSRSTNKSFCVTQDNRSDNKEKTNTCMFCHKGRHFLSRCEKFKRLTPCKRYTLVRDNNWCYNCLSPNHGVRSCPTDRVCSECTKKHHYLLHLGRPLAGVQHDQGVHGAVPSEVNASSDVSNTNTTSENFCGTTIKNRNNTVLLSTVVVNVLNGSGQGQTARFLLDSGSQVHLITQKCSKKLGLKISRCSVSVQGIGSNTYSVRGITDLIVASRYDSSKKYFMQALLVDKISDRLPRVKIERSFLGSFGDIQLADNKFDEPTEIDGIIGAELFATVMGNKSYAPSAGSPVAVQTVFGYVIMGKVPILNSVSDSRVFFNLKEESSLNELMTKFWEIEQVPKNTLPDAEELECDKMYTSTFNRDSEGRFTVALPFKNSPSTLGDSKTGAMTRLYSLERRLTKFPELRSGYNDIMRESIEQGHMHWVKDEYLKAADTTYYIPHHAIFKPDSSSTPIRIVLDASASSDSDISLNDILYGGPKLQTDIFSLLLNFRLFRIAVTADIRRMYHQIKLVNYHWRFQRLLWRFSPDEPVRVYEFNRLAFGVKTSPYLALRTVKQLIKEEGYKYPLAAEVVSTDLYMDDLVCSVSSEEEAQRLYSESVAMFAEGKFDLTKWSSSSLELLEKIPFEKRLSQPVLFKTETKILGMFWNPEMDSFRFKFPVPGSSCTKRLILSTVARCYDPVGLVAPFVLYLKLLIKELWKLKIGWDDIVPYEVSQKWLNLKDEWSVLGEIQFSRYMGTLRTSPVMLVAFADASMDGYGAVVYVRIVTENGEIVVNLLCAKSKVSPFKIVTIPRLELVAALLLSRLVKHVLKIFNNKVCISKIFAFSDSTTVLQWINSTLLKDIFVANRVAQIKENMSNAEWCHISGLTNPADILSRGATPSQLMENYLWISGPTWMKLPVEDWPISEKSCFENCGQDIDSIKCLVSMEDTETHPLYEMIMRSSSYITILRITVRVLRFVKLLPVKEIITASDMNRAELVLVRIVQGKYFASDIKHLNLGKRISNRLRKLNPFLQNGVLMVGGRLENAPISFAARHPIILPGKDPFTEKLIDYYHKIHLHTGPYLMEAILRQKFWILGGRNVIRQRVHACNKCFRLKPKTINPLMADLPTSRLHQAKVFSHTGIDYFGPFSITLGRRRGAQVYKGYVCLFVCMSVKAIHLELVSSLSTDSFLQALKRFLSRRGPCSVIYSDQGTNFVGAKTVLREINEFVNSARYKKAFQTELAINGIEWKLNTPAAPHMGGLWESHVKCAKTHIFRVIGTQLLTFEEFNTLLIQVEALLNSRPLCSLSADPSAPEALTPSHFLTIIPLKGLPADNLIDININRIDRFQLIDRMVQDYWKRWHLEYLTTLQVREKWNTKCPNIKVGTTVILKNDNSPPLHWPLAIITDVHPGKDGIIRNVTVRTNKGTYSRPVVKVCPLPTQ